MEILLSPLLTVNISVQKFSVLFYSSSQDDFIWAFAFLIFSLHILKTDEKFQLAFAEHLLFMWQFCKQSTPNICFQQAGSPDTGKHFSVDPNGTIYCLQLCTCSDIPCLRMFPACVQCLNPAGTLPLL